ncbi:SDR family oxidoreductase [Rarobacter incanus]|uniref:3alpha(Or 20beta)-hydroxysteroid dehydrogenase n=1 Tax=Rarobacter incanus TaxID=153494 RepID=A0A542SQL5_9MICO|nr:SDR family oxidoreductase [Rarobacter incanus]TQK76894.1 3alpha(or 20beta)-hydroxysteroid dehydrogenase [Rarobacter incanus]
MTSTTGRVAGKVALISGGARGMGAAHARTLVAEGAKVVIGDLLTDEGTALAAELGEDNALFVTLNVTDYDSWAAAVQASVQKFGKLDVLVNNAGIFTRGNVEDATVDDFVKTIDIDLNGVFFGTKAAIGELKKNETSSIINISSIAGLVGFKNRVAYAAAKWGVMGITKTSALDFGADGVRVNSIHPGSVNTPLTAGLKRGFGQIPAGRAAEQEEISALVLYLASDESRFVNGSSIAIDGGETAGNNLRADS